MPASPRYPAIAKAVEIIGKLGVAVADSAGRRVLDAELSHAKNRAAVRFWVDGDGRVLCGADTGYP